jgi:uncharacterized protein (DUF2062 family)
VKPPKRKNIFVTILRQAKVHLHKIYYARGSAHEIALGAAIGAFWGVFPTFGLSTILSVLLYKVFRFNLVVAISAAFISNPLTSPFLLVLSFRIGLIFTHVKTTFDLNNWYSNLGEVGLTMLIGSFLLSFFTAIIVFMLTKYFIEKRRQLAAGKEHQ